MQLSTLLAGFVDRLQPDRCCFCNAVCQPLDGITCKYCFPSVYSTKGDATGQFQLGASIGYPFEDVISCWPHASFPAIASAIYQLKYGGKQHVGIRLGCTLGHIILAKKLDYHYLIPVPMPANKLKIRGFNQAFAIANGVKMVTGIPVFSDALVPNNTKNKSQASTGARVRLKAQLSNYSLTNPEIIAKKTLLLIDDVITTGATIAGLASILSAAMPNSISAASIIYTPSHLN